MHSQTQLDQTHQSDNAAPQLTVLLPPIHPSTHPPIHPSAGPSTPPVARRRTRNGKIARLPYVERDMVNRMLRDGIPHEQIRDALDEHGIRVTERNISNWKTRGGYQEWCLEQDRALENRLRQDNLTEHLKKHDASELPEVGLQLAATNLSQFFLNPETQKQLATDPEKFARSISMICRLSRHIHTLQKYRDDTAKELDYKYNPERIKRDDEKHMEGTREIYSAQSLGERPSDPIIHRRNYLPKHWDNPPEPLA